MRFHDRQAGGESTEGALRLAAVAGLIALVAFALVESRSPQPVPRPPPAQASAEPAGPPGEGLRRSDRFAQLYAPYPRAQLVPMGRVEANGNPTEFHYFETTDPPQNVLEFYRAEFEKRGHSVRLESGAVSYYDDAEGSLVIVSVTTDANSRRTLAFASIVEVPQGLNVAAKAPENLPRPPGAVDVVRVDDLNPGRAEGSTSLTQLASGTPAELASFYAKEMQARGYRIEQSRIEREVHMLDFEGEQGKVSFKISELTAEGPPESVVAVVMEPR